MHSACSAHCFLISVQKGLIYFYCLYIQLYSFLLYKKNLCSCIYSLVFDFDSLLQFLAIPLSAYKFSSSSLKWFKSYLESCQQTVQSDRGLSAFANIKSGVPQGSILGPTLFLLFINDFPLLLKYCYADLFADDATVHNNSPDIDEINEEMLIDFLKIVGWSK